MSVLKGEGAEQFGVRALLDPVIAEQPSRLATLERQLMLINARPGVRITDTAARGDRDGERPFPPRRLPCRPGTSMRMFGLDNLGSASVGPWQSYAPRRYNSYLIRRRYAGAQSVDHARRSAPARFGRLSYDVPIGIDGCARRRVRPLQRGLARRFPARLQRQHQDRSVRIARRAIAPLQTPALDADAHRCNRLQQCQRAATCSGRSISTSIRTFSLNADYRLQDNFGGTNYLTVHWRQGLDILGASHKGDDFLSRDGASGKFSALNFWFTRYQTITDALSVKLASRRPGGIRSAVPVAAILSRRRSPSDAAMARPRSAATTASPARSNCASTRN